MHKTYVKILFTFIAHFFVGITGYRLIEGWDLIDSFYMTAITISTVGYQEALPLSDAGQIFTSIYIIIGIVIMASIIAVITSVVIEGVFHEKIRRRKMVNEIAKLRDHHIIVGSGRVGSEIIEQMCAAKQTFVLIENDTDKIEYLKEEKGVRYCIHGDATDEKSLYEAGIENASGIILAIGNDAENLFSIVTVRGISKHIKIISRASSESSRKKFIHAGANSVINPGKLTGIRLTNMLLKPSVVDLMDGITDINNANMTIEQVILSENSALIKKSIIDAAIPKKTGFLILAITSTNGAFLFNPKPDLILEAGDTLVLAGDPARLSRLYEVIS